MKVKKKELEVFTVSTEELLNGLVKEWIDSPWDYGKLIDVKEEVTAHGKSFAFVFTEPRLNLDKNTRKIRNELRAKLETAGKEIKEINAKVDRGEITILESMPLIKKALDGFKIVGVDKDDVLRLIYKIKFPSFWGSFFKAEAWVDPSGYRRIAKVELTDDGIEFTVAKTELP